METYTQFSRNKNSRRFSPEFIAAVREHSPIELVASAYTKLRKSGCQLVGLCPFHEERTPSFYVHPAKGAFFCHGCGARGDVFSFTKAVLVCDFRQSVDYLSARAGISQSGFTPAHELRLRVARVATRRLEERKFKDFWNCRIDAINAKHRALGRAATNAEICLRSGKLRTEEKKLAWDALERYLSFALRVEREGLCDVEVLRREWLARTRREGRNAA